MFAYCNNNPIKYVDYGGNLASMNDPGKNRVYINDGAGNATTYAHKLIKDAIKQDYISEGKIIVRIKMDVLVDHPLTTDQYTALLSFYLEDKYAEFFDGDSIDQAQLYGEIKFHQDMYELGILKGRANPADIEIYPSGEVIDARPIVYSISKENGKEYNEYAIEDYPKRFKIYFN